MTFEVGDKVIYPNHGLGIVETIEEKTIMGTTCGFYMLRLASSDTTVLVPVDNVDGVGLRGAVGEDEIARLYTLLANGKIDSHQNWKGRFKDNSEKMRSGSIYDAVDVLKNLAFLSRSKSLSFREKRMLDRARFLVVSEISEVSQESTEAVEERVEAGTPTLLREQGAGGGAGGGAGESEDRQGVGALGEPPDDADGAGVVASRSGTESCQARSGNSGSGFFRSGPGWKYGCHLWVSRRPPSKARGARIPGVCKRRATMLGGDASATRVAHAFPPGSLRVPALEVIVVH